MGMLPIVDCQPVKTSVGIPHEYRWVRTLPAAQEMEARIRSADPNGELPTLFRSGTSSNSIPPIPSATPSPCQSVMCARSKTALSNIAHIGNVNISMDARPGLIR